VIRSLELGPTKLTLIRPNPFSGTTEVRFTLSREAHARLFVYDVAGRLVRRVLDEARPVGSHGISWNGTDVNDRAVPAGTYFLRFDADGVKETRKLVLIR